MAWGKSLEAVQFQQIIGPRSGNTRGTSVKEQKENRGSEVVQSVGVSNNSMVIAFNQYRPGHREALAGMEAWCPTMLRSGSAGMWRGMRQEREWALVAQFHKEQGCSA